MNRYRDAVALRRGIEDRLAAAAGRDGIDLNRLRRRLVFERVLARLSRNRDPDWVLKGGFLLEARLQSRARATRDLDLAVCAVDLDGVAVRAHLIDACSSDPDGDTFLFTVDVPRVLRADQAGRPGWRDGRDPPIAPPDPPPQWAQQFAAHVEALELSTPDLVAATRMLHGLWHSVCPSPTTEEKSS